MDSTRELQPAYLIHLRPFRETSAIAELWTANFGRVSAVAKSARAVPAKKNRFKDLHPFQPLQVSWRGHSELKSLTAVELASPRKHLLGERLYCGLYVNELLYRLLPNGESTVTLFADYIRTLDSLADTNAPLEVTLRSFEFTLLGFLGYLPDFRAEASSGAAIMPEREYDFVIDEGFVRCDEQPPSSSGTSNHRIRGELILALADLTFDRPQLALAKQVARRLIAPLLGNKPLKSRELFVDMVKAKRS